jgi:hypothetical protein
MLAQRQHKVTTVVTVGLAGLHYSLTLATLNTKETHNMTQIQDPVTAFALAVSLAINAPDDESSDRAVALAEEIAMHLTPEQVEQVKAQYEMEG